MTLIAYHGFGDGARLVFVSDIIISSTLNSVNDLNLPTIGISGGVVLNNTEHKIFGLGQKVAILNNNLAVAASGTKISYRAFAKYLGDLYNKKNIYSPNDFMELIQAYLNDEDTKAGLGHFDVFVAYINIIDGRQTGAITFISSERNPRPPANYDSPLFEQVIALGSGAPSYVEVAGTMKLVSDKRRFANQSIREITRTFLTIGKFLAQEVSSGQGRLHEYWGGRLRNNNFRGRPISKTQQYFVRDCRGNFSKQTPRGQHQTHQNAENALHRSPSLCAVGRTSE